jgi:hypothetical protein
MAKKSTGEKSELYRVEAETTHRRRDILWPDGESELVDFTTAVGRLATYTRAVDGGLLIEGRKASSVVALHLVEVSFDVVDGKPIGEPKTKAVETRRRRWGWADRPLAQQKRAA